MNTRGGNCIGCEQFYRPTELSDGRCVEHGTEPAVVAERNWFFRLSRYEERILDAIESGRLRIEPAARRNEVVSFIRSGLEDVSVSRSAERARGWGIPVPDDPEQVVYVWYDALSNYITALGYGTGAESYRTWWADAEERVHIIGKGILRFHAVYWPAFLLSAGEPLPTAIFVHDYLTAGGVKISKSSGNGVEPATLIARYGADAVRWWLAADVPRVGETDFAEPRLVDRANQDLANGFGNLVSRIAGLAAARGVSLPARPTDGDPLLDGCTRTRADVLECLADFDIRAAADGVAALIRSANAYIQRHRPWEVQSRAAASPDGIAHVVGVLWVTARSIAELLTIFTPDLAARSIARLEGLSDGTVQPRLATPDR